MIKKQFRKKFYQHKYFRTILCDDYDFTTTEHVDYTFVREYLGKIVSRLPDKRREIFIKSRFEYKSVDEIARDMGISRKTVENQLTLALKYLRENLTFLIFAFIVLINLSH